MTMNQRDYYKQKINKLLPEFPEYIEDFVDTHYDNLSPLTLHRYLETYKNFLTWTIQETISSAENIKDVKLSTLENITKKEMESYFKNLSREEINGKYRTQTTINNYKAAMRSLYKFLTVTSETEQGRAYFERNVMLKIPINRVKETLSSRSKKISEKIEMIEDKLEKNNQRMLEIMGVFLAIFSIININIGKVSNDLSTNIDKNTDIVKILSMDIYKIIVINISIVACIIVLFWVIRKNDKNK